MSLTSESASVAHVKLSLRTADQYALWKARISATCWAKTKQNVFDVTDDKCGFGPLPDGQERKIPEWVGIAWMSLIESLHDELFIRLVHVEHGRIATLQAEIRAALLVNLAEDVQPLRVELYSASMARDCGQDLQTYISFISQRKDKLTFLGVPVPEGELVAIFLKGLSPAFQPLQVHFSIPGQVPDSFAKAVDILRRFAATPAMAAELARLKNATVAHSVFASLPRDITPSDNRPRATCLKFAKNGICSYGTRCRFSHEARAYEYFKVQFL
jgi:hypothetical protein